MPASERSGQWTSLWSAVLVTSTVRSEPAKKLLISRFNRHTPDTSDTSQGPTLLKTHPTDSVLSCTVNNSY